MRISRIQLAGLALALAGGAAQEAAADPLTITTATTDPVVTSNAANASAGSVTVNSGGSITVDATETAITMDSDNDVSNSGTLASDNANGTRGIVISGVRAGTITNAGAINLTEDATLDDTDNDGDLDGDFASGSNRFGILLDGGSLTGDIISSGTMQIEGNNSGAIWLDGVLNGDLNVTGNVSVVGDNSTAYLIDGAVNGDVLLRGDVIVYGENSSGLAVNAPVSGQVRISGAWTVSGFHSLTAPADVSHLDADDLLVGGPAIGIYSDVTGGVTIEGIGVEDDLDDNGDLSEEPTDTNDDDRATIISVGSSPAVLVQADSIALSLGATPAVAPGYAGGYGFHNRGSITSNGVYDGFSATTVRLEGLGGGTVSTSAGFANDGLLVATANGAGTRVIDVGSGVTINELLNRRSISTTVISDTADTAAGVHIASGAVVPTIINTGTWTAVYGGAAGDAVAIRDLSNTLTHLTNSGTITADVVSTDGSAITGSAIALDLSTSSAAFTLDQIADVPYTDDDGVDDDASIRPDVLMRGQILLGSGADTVNLQAGSILGALSFGAGADTFLIEGGALYKGMLTDFDGALSITVNDGTLELRGGATNITTASFSADSQLNVLLSQVPLESSLLTSSGTITFAPGATVTPLLPAGLPVADTIVFLTANGGLFLFGGASVLGPVTTGSFLYNVDVELTDTMAADGDPNSLQAVYDRKTAAELNMNRNQSIAFNPILDALINDDDASAAFAALDNEDDFFDAYNDLMPTFASGAAELAATAIQQAQSATSNRLSSTRLHDMNQVSVWAQEIGYGLNRTPADVNGVEFRGTGFGLATGIDGPLNNGGLFGLSASFIASEAEEPGRPDGEISASFGQFNAYLGIGAGAIDLDFIGGLGVGKMRSRRFVEIGDTFSAMSEADWWSYEGHGAVRASAPMRISNGLVLTPQAALTYVYLSEEAYSEEGGGAGLDYDADSATTQRLWGDVGVELSTRWRRGASTVIAPRVFVGYRANVIDDGAERTFRFQSGTQDFTLTDEGVGDGGPLVGLGIDATNGYSTFTLGYEGEFGDQIERHSLNASIRFRF